MSQYRTHLPQLDGGLFLTDGGLETTLIFHDGLELPYFAAFHLLEDERRRGALRRYFEPLSSRSPATPALGFVLETPTWRANPDWGAKLGYSRAALADAQPRGRSTLMAELRERVRRRALADRDQRLHRPARRRLRPGRRDDAPTRRRTTTPGRSATFADTDADLVTAITHDLRRGGDRHRARRRGRPACRWRSRSRVETDGRLPTGQTAGRGDRARSTRRPAARRPTT